MCLRLIIKSIFENLINLIFADKLIGILYMILLILIDGEKEKKMKGKEKAQELVNLLLSDKGIVTSELMDFVVFPYGKGKIVFRYLYRVTPVKKLLFDQGFVEFIGIVADSTLYLNPIQFITTLRTSIFYCYDVDASDLKNVDRLDVSCERFINEISLIEPYWTKYCDEALPKEDAIDLLCGIISLEEYASCRINKDWTWKKNRIDKYLWFKFHVTALVALVYRFCTNPLLQPYSPLLTGVIDSSGSLYVKESLLTGERTLDVLPEESRKLGNLDVKIFR